MSIILYSFFAFIISAGLLISLRGLAIKAAFVDDPSEQDRKKHIGAIPPIGGPVVFLTGGIISLLAGFDWAMYWPLLAASSLCLIIGIVDDKYHLHSSTKLIVQVLVALILVVPGNVHLHELGDLFGMGQLNSEYSRPGFLFSAWCY